MSNTTSPRCESLWLDDVDESPRSPRLSKVLRKRSKKFMRLFDAGESQAHSKNPSISSPFEFSHVAHIDPEGSFGLENSMPDITVPLYQRQASQQQKAEEEEKRARQSLPPIPASPVSFGATAPVAAPPIDASIVRGNAHLSRGSVSSIVRSGRSSRSNSLYTTANNTFTPTHALRQGSYVSANTTPAVTASVCSDYSFLGSPKALPPIPQGGEVSSISGEEATMSSSTNSHLSRLSRDSTMATSVSSLGVYNTKRDFRDSCHLREIREYALRDLTRESFPSRENSISISRASYRAETPFTVFPNRSASQATSPLEQQLAQMESDSDSVSGPSESGSDSEDDEDDIPSLQKFSVGLQTVCSNSSAGSLIEDPDKVAALQRSKQTIKRNSEHNFHVRNTSTQMVKSCSFQQQQGSYVGRLPATTETEAFEDFFADLGIESRRSTAFGSELEIDREFELMRLDNTL